MIALIISVWLLIQTTPVQNFLVRQVTNRISHDLNTQVRIKHVNFALFNSMLLEGMLVEDQKKDTLLYAGSVKVNITDWFFFKEKIELEYIGLQDAVFHLNRTDSLWNYTFLFDYFSGPSTGTKKKNIDLNLKVIEFDRIRIVQRDEWRGEDMGAFIRSMKVDAEQMDISNRILSIRSINLVQPEFSVSNYTGRRIMPPDTATTESVIVNDSLNLRWNPGNWNVKISSLNITEGMFRSDVATDRQPYPHFDGAHIRFANINARFVDCRLLKDSILAKFSLSTKERSGFDVKELSAHLRMHPEAMEFSNFNLKTNRSQLSDYFAMRYSSFEDMNSFISKVRMQAHFKNSVISTDDIAFFAPELSTWKKAIQASGTVSGSVDNLNGKNLVIQAGNDTYLKGNLSLAGLPDLSRTYIDFEAENFRTTYKDALSFVPPLRNITQPRLDLMNYLRFRGNFTGFFQDFVTYGSLETNLGTIITDLNMKLPDNKPSSYSGSLSTSGFEIGKLIDNSSIGKIIFKGKVNGTGLRPATLNAKLDGDIQLLEFNRYAYQGITVKGQVAKKLFDGEMIANDPNLQARLNGLVDFSKEIPEFNFEANITKADLMKLNLLKDQVEFDGKFKFNFKGSNIDNFLGSARIFDASLFKSGRRISFDSLYIESNIVDNNKVITAVSNEFDAALAGEFSIKDLPAAFQTFLNKYYPAYIKPSKKILRNENFSFVITTKNVEEYVNLIDPDLKGFNFSTLTGRINTRENLLDLNAEVPQFNYKNIAVYDMRLKATGASDSLLLESNISNVFINDSLNFPNTEIKLQSANDISEIRVITSANQTLNAASIAAQVKTLPKGASVKFRESSFDLKGKTWTIQKDGEITVTEDLLAATGIRLSNGLQEIRLSSVDSDTSSKKDLQVELEKVNIGDFSPYLVTSNKLEGLITGKIKVADPFGKFKLNVVAETEQFRLDDDSIGTLALRGNYDHRLKEVDFSARSDNHNYNFDLKGLYQIGDSTKNENLDITTNLNGTKIDLLQRYLSGVFSDLSGDATGTLRISGPADKLNYLGTIQLKNGALRVKFTNVLYSIPNAKIELKEDRIDFGSFQFVDNRKNTGTITKGILYHEGFDNLSFDFEMNTPKLLVLSTTNTGDDPFYGSVIASADMSFKGPLADMQMNITAQPADSSNLYINTNSGKQSGQADFIVWKVYGKEMKSIRTFKESNLTVNLDVTANNYANMYVILDELTGDIIKATGRGNLKVRATTDGEFSITGRYDIDRGNYNFNFESLLKKPFRLREGVGNYIQWSGDPANAQIKIDAEYEAENVRFSDLGSAIRQSFEVDNNLLRYRGKAIVVANLTDQLMSPQIKFSIELPPNSPIKNDVGIQQMLERIQKDENELNKQVAFLVVFNSFGPLSNSADQAGIANTAFEGLVVGNISGVISTALSRQFSSVFQKVFNDKSIQVNLNAQFYSAANIAQNLSRTSIGIDRTNVNLSVGKSIFNDRLTFTLGSAVDFGITASSQFGQSKNLPFLPDVTAEWKITTDGKLLLTFFYRDSYTYLVNAAMRQNRTGASISYRKDFERFGELVEPKKKKKPAPKETDTSQK